MKRKLVGILFLITCCCCQTAAAFSLQSLWDDLWYTADQQGARALKNKNPALAAQRFKNSAWQGVANYRAQNFDAAEKAFATEKSAVANYNRGNAFAFAKKYSQAIDAYELALRQDPHFADAKYNRDLVKKLLEQNKQQQQQQNNQSSSAKDNNNQNNNSENKDNQSADNQQQQKDRQQQVNQQSQDLSKLMQSLNGQHKNQQPQQNQPKSTQQHPDQSPKPKDTSDLKQWLQEVPDDPGGLLKQKFLRDHQRLMEK